MLWHFPQYISVIVWRKCRLCAHQKMGLWCRHTDTVIIYQQYIRLPAKLSNSQADQQPLCLVSLKENAVPLGKWPHKHLIPLQQTHCKSVFCIFCLYTSDWLPPWPLTPLYMPVKSAKGTEKCHNCLSAFGRSFAAFYWPFHYQHKTTNRQVWS